MNLNPFQCCINLENISRDYVFQLFDFFEYFGQPQGVATKILCNHQQIAQLK